MSYRHHHHKHSRHHDKHSHHRPRESTKEYSNPHSELKIIKTDFEPTGEAFQIVRSVDNQNETSEDIINRLIKQYGQKTDRQRAHKETVQAAFPSVANKLLKSYEGSNIIADSQQDLIGDRYLAEQIRQINEENRKKSILDKWSHLLYEGEDERTYISNYQPPAFEPVYIQPIRSTTYTLSNQRLTKND